MTSFLLIISIGITTDAQTFSRYIVRFKDKGSNSFSLNNPSAFLSQRSIDRRSRYKIPLDSTDLPVSKRYLDSIGSVTGVTLLNVSKWLNQVSILITDASALNKINSFPFVQTVNPIAAMANTNTPVDVSRKFEETDPIYNQIQSTLNITSNFYDYGLSLPQIAIHNGEFLHNIGLRGQNMVVGMLDAGYFKYQTLKAFDSALANGQILGTWDFVDREASVNEDHSHGMAVLSVMVANIPGQFIGSAPKASYYLYRSEEAATEYPIEEHNWVCAAERTDSVGGDVINSSLGYHDLFNDPIFNYSYADMDGNTTISAKGADLAAKKGIFVVNSAGNEGNNPWKFIVTPADGDSVLAVGAVNTSGIIAGFSSWGPSADGQVKPDVVSVGAGIVVQTTANTIGTSNGTSFASPNMAGLATCLWQGFQEFNNMKIINALRQAGSRASNPDDRYGYGIPDMRKATMILLKDYSTAKPTINNCIISLEWNSKDVASMKYELERKAPGETTFTKIHERFGSGSIFGNRTYGFEDPVNNFPNGTITYRIKQIIDTAASTTVSDYIDTVIVNFNSTNCTIDQGNDQFILMPNPATHQLSIQITTQEAVQDLQIRIIDNLGQQVKLEKRSKPAGTAVFPVFIHQLAQGKYYVTIFKNGSMIGTKEFIKVL